MSIKRISTILFLFLYTFLKAQTFSVSDFNLIMESFFVPEQNTPIVKTETGLSARFLPTNFIVMNLDVSASIDNIPSFLHPLTEYRRPAYLYFDGAFIQFPYVNERSTILTIFSGFFDDPSSSSLLREYFKIIYTKPTFRTLPSGDIFDPHVDISGTGIALTGVPGNKNMALGAYGYWNSLTGDKATITGDFRIATLGTIFSANAYMGFLTNITTAKTFMRGGFSSLFGIDSWPSST